MACFSCLRSFKTLARAAAKASSARLRRLGLAASASDWPRRAAVCEYCHLRVIHGGESYCGRPLLRQMLREPAVDGCGCPCAAKARDPREHCPLNTHGRPAQILDDACDCKWCAAA